MENRIVISGTAPDFDGSSGAIRKPTQHLLPMTLGIQEMFDPPSEWDGDVIYQGNRQLEVVRMRNYGRNLLPMTFGVPDMITHETVAIRPT